MCNGSTWGVYADLRVSCTVSLARFSCKCAETSYIYVYAWLWFVPGLVWFHKDSSLMLHLDYNSAYGHCLSVVLIFGLYRPSSGPIALRNVLKCST